MCFFFLPFAQWRKAKTERSRRGESGRRHTRQEEQKEESWQKDAIQEVASNSMTMSNKLYTS